MPTSQPSPQLKRISLRGADLRYVDQGQGPAVIFVHGGASDHRVWENQRSVVAERYRFLAIDQRYFGREPWLDNGAQFSLATHTADLVAFIAALDIAPVYLVGQSYGAVVTLMTATLHPHLIRALLIIEPPLMSALTDRDDIEIAQSEARELASVAAAARAGDAAGAVRSFHDWIDTQPGAFDLQAPGFKAMRYDNARTLAFQLSPATRASITCAELAALAIPVTITSGASTRAYFRVIAAAVHRCISGSTLVTIPGARHGAPVQAPERFNQILLSFLVTW